MWQSKLYNLKLNLSKGEKKLAICATLSQCLNDKSVIKGLFICICPFICNELGNKKRAMNESSKN